MKKIIYCTYLKKKSEGQDFQLYPGKIGKRIFDTISKEAWEKWQIQQTMLINEQQLDMMNLFDRKYLEKEMINFLFKE
ncbi:oxidative damage protection protein [Candidatus Palibaumannia cicadellinicola]|nr:oxidative damage protection protein [Candidatus Baumannia cicadellinicola]